MPLELDPLLLPAPPPVPTGAEDFACGLNSVVAIEIDLNASGAPASGSEDTGGGPVENYQPVSGLAAVPCRIVQQNWPPPTQMWTKTMQSATGWSKVLFAGVIALDERHRLVYQDPATSATRYLYVIGQSKNAHQMGLFSRADVMEFEL